MVCVGIMRGRGCATPTSRIGGRIPAHATALGKAMLAYSEQAEVDAVVSAGLTPWTPHTVVEPERLMAQLAEVRLTGLATEREEFAVGVCGVASPVFSPSRRLVAAISVSGPVGDFHPDRSAPAVRGAAVALARRLAPAGPVRPDVR
jgi:IclR family transcriptional regulator, acetate operon repressor